MKGTAPELNDDSLLLLADLARLPEGKSRTFQRGGGLLMLNSPGYKEGRSVPSSLTALVDAGLVSVRRTSSTGYTSCITDAGRKRHRQLVTLLRSPA